MTTEIARSVLHHREQSVANRCVPACAAMALSRLGRPMDEDAICASWQGSRRGYPLNAAETILGGRYLQLDPDNPGNYDWIHLQLQEARWFLVEVSGEKLARIVQAMASPPESRFGPVSFHSYERHVVVLVAAVNGSFHFLDPYYPAAGQPFSMTRQAFAQAFTGRLVEVPLMAPGDT